jgi:VanZ like family
MTPREGETMARSAAKPRETRQAAKAAKTKPAKTRSMKPESTKDESAKARSPKADPAKPARVRTPAARAPRAQARSKPVRFAYAAARALALLVLTACFVEVLRLTLSPSPASVGIAHTNLHPGATIRLYLEQPSVREAVIQIGGNILIGVPFGLLLPMLYPRTRGLIRVVLVTSFVILLIELTQHYFIKGRSFDVDDIILAAVGAAIGYVPLGRRFGRMTHPDHRHWWERQWERMRTRG